MEPVEDDTEAHNPGWDFSELDAYDDAYVRAIADHLGCIAPAGDYAHLLSKGLLTGVSPPIAGSLQGLK